MSLATTSVPVSESLVRTGHVDSSARITSIGLFRSILTTSSLKDDAETYMVRGSFCAFNH